MTLIAIIGDLGAGKTLTMTYLAVYNWYKKHPKIYTNYHLKGIPFTYVNSLEQLNEMKQGMFFGDEFWMWVDCRAHRSKRNMAIDKIIAMSRKRGVHIFYTCRNIMRMDIRIREHTDFIVEPRLAKFVNMEGVDTPVPLMCTIYWYEWPGNFIRRIATKIMKFYTLPIMAVYNTYEEIDYDLK